MTGMTLALMLAACERAEQSPVEPTNTAPTADTGSPALPPDDTGTPSIDADGDGFFGDDCDDTDETVHPGAADVCGDDRVTDCDRDADEDLVTIEGGATFTTVTAALDAVAPGDVVLVCPGTYQGRVRSGVPVALVAHGDAASTVLRGQGYGSVLQLAAGSTVVGFTLTGGEAFVGGGAVFVGPGEWSLRDSVVSGNTATNGGGLWIESGAVVDLTGTTVTANVALWGGGVGVRDGTLIGGVVSVNEAEEGGGGALYGVVLVQGTEFADNVAADYGGGIAADGGVSLVDVLVRYNTATLAGGGILVEEDTRVDLVGTTLVSFNEAEVGGGVILSRLATLSGGEVSDNLAFYYGGGASMTSATVEGTVMLRNQAAFSGGAVYASDADSRSSIRGATLGANVAVDGGGVATGYSDLILSDVLLEDNAATRGGAIHVSQYSSVDVTASTLRRNAAPFGAGAFVAAVAGYRTGTLESFASDWSAGADDNVGPDVSTDAGSYAGYEADETFTCTWGVCDPAP